MALDAWLSQDVVIRRGTEALDAYNNASLEPYDVALVPGRLVEKRERIWSTERQESLVVTGLFLLVPASADVQKRDWAVVDSVTYTITGIVTRSARATHHLSLAVEKVA